MSKEKRKIFERHGKIFTKKGGDNMTTEDRMLMVETISEIKELKGQMREFRTHVIGRIEKLEKKEGERSKERISVISILISAAALAVSIIVNFFRGRQ